MNCLQARREILQDPHHCSNACYKHLEECSSCRAEYQRLMDIEQQLRSATRIEPPAGLRDRLLMQGHYQAATLACRRYWLSGVAASALLVAGLLSFQPWLPEDPMAQTVLSHVNDELHHLHEVHDITDAKLQMLLKGLDGRYRNTGLQLNYAGRCRVRAQQGLHLVARGQQGPVSILVMPGEHRDGELKVRDQRFQGRIYDAPYGSFAVVGERNEDIAPIAEQVKRAIEIGI